MIYLLLGEDIYAKQQYLDEVVSKENTELEKFGSNSSLPQLSQLGSASLFGAAPIYVFSNCLANYELVDLEKVAENLVPIYFLEETLDKRLSKNKSLLKIAKVLEFPAPSIEQGKAWIIDHADSLGIKIQTAAAVELCKRLCGQTKKNLPVVMAHYELLKLSSHADQLSITPEMVSQLTPQDFAIDMFALLDLIATGQKAQASKMLEQYYEASSEDDKVLTIRLAAILSEQLRGLLITKQLLGNGLTDKQIIEATGWKTGRLFIMKKLSKNFSEQSLSRTLSKLFNLDKELKSSTLPPKVVVGMILAVM